MSTTSPTQSEPSSARNEVCACPNCDCPIADQHVFVVNKVAYCCEFCAEGHPNHEPCSQEGCRCGQVSSAVEVSTAAG